MKRIDPFTDRLRIPDHTSRDIDTLLGDFFHAEMPDPWPGPPVPAGRVPKTGLNGRHVLPLRRPTRKWTRARRQLTLAAALALFVLGYFGLSALFPTTLPDGFRMKAIEELGQKNSPNFIPDTQPGGTPGVDPLEPGAQNSGETIKLPNGGARVYEHQMNGKMFIRVEALPKP